MEVTESVQSENAETEERVVMSEEEKAAWQKPLAEQIRRRKIEKYALRFLYLAAVIFLVAAVLTVVVWSKKDELEKLLNFNKTVETANVLVMLAFVCFGILKSYPFVGGVVFTQLCRNAVVREKLDVKQYVRANKGIFKKDEVDAMECYLSAEYFAEFPNYKTVEIIKAAVCAIAEAVSVIFIGVFAATAIKCSMKAGKLDVDFTQLNFGLLIMWGVSLAVSLVVEIVYNLTLKKQMKKWVDDLLVS